MTINNIIMRNLNWVTLSVIGIAAMLSMSACNGNGDGSASEQIVNLAEVESANGSRHASYPGRTEAITTTNLSFMVMGTIDKVLVKEGDAVKKGQVLARLDNRDYKTQLDATESEYRQIKAECERVMSMYAEHAVSANDYDKAKSGLERITAKLEHHRAQVEDCEIRAPYNGFVSHILRQEREVAAPGIPVISVFSNGGYEIVINIPETELNKRGKVVAYTATFSSMPGKHFPLFLNSVSASANANQLYEAHLTPKENIEGLTPGMTVMVEFTYGETDGNKPNNVLVPMGAVCNDGAETYVFVYNDEDGTISRTPVVVNKMCCDGMVEISSGLQIGQRVVASGTHYVTDGQKVRTLAPTSALNEGDVL